MNLQCTILSEKQVDGLLFLKKSAFKKRKRSTLLLNYWLILSILNVLFFSINIAAQRPTYIHYTLEEGLPSLQTYHLMQDQKGYIWFATSMGVSRFDGTTFTNFTTANGLPDNNVWDIRTDTVGKIWILTANGKTAVLEKEQFKTAKTTIFGRQVIGSGDLVIDYTQSLRYFRDSLAQDLLPNQLQYFKQNVSCTLPESEHQLWIGTWGGGAFYCSDYKTDSQRVRAFLPGKTITSILKDTEGNYWFTTLDEGVFLLTNIQVLTFTTLDGLPHDDMYAITQSPDRNLWVGSSRGTISEIRPDSILNFEVSSTVNTYSRINDIFIDQQDNKWIASDEGFKLLDNQGNLFLVDVTATKSIEQTGANSIWVAKYQDPIRIDMETLETVKNVVIRQVSSVVEAQNGQIWIGTTQGLYLHQNDSTEYLGLRHELLTKSITALHISPQGILWIATDGYGLLLFQNGNLLNITTQNGLSSNICRSVFLDGKNEAWIATNKGLNKLTINHLDAHSLVIKQYSYLDGLASNQVNDVCVDGDSVWVATLKGVTFFRQSDTIRRTPPPIYIRQVEMWHEPQPLQAKYRFRHYENNIKIDYTGLSFKSDGQLQYQYQMLGIDTAWQMTSLATIQYPALPSGGYTFRVRAIDKDGVTSKQTAAVQFDIALPVWQTWWFTILVSLISMSLLGLVIYGIIRYFKDRSDLETRLVESEQMALRAQMNPHFIFNSLNSIQYFITENDKKSANLYLSVFSELMRKVLDYSQKSHITLEEELDYLRLYMDIESLRFKGKFKYEIAVAAEVEADDVQIPPMLVQPYVENAIRHGLLQKKEGDRQLTVYFEEQDEMLTCTIQDNGIGRKQAQAMKRQRPNAAHKGIGTTNPKARLAILNRFTEQPIKVTITDLYEKERATGTKIVIYVPME